MAELIERSRRYVRISYARATGIEGNRYGESGRMNVFEKSGALLGDDPTILGSFAESAATWLERASINARRGDRISFSTVLIGGTGSEPFPIPGSDCSGDLTTPCDLFEMNWSLSARITFLCNLFKIAGVSGSSTVSNDEEIISSDHFRYYADVIPIYAQTEVGKQIDPELGELFFETVEVQCITGVPWLAFKESNAA